MDVVERVYEFVYSGAYLPPDPAIPVSRSHLVFTAIARSSTPAYDCLK